MCETYWCNTCNDILQVTPACPCPEQNPPVQITSTGNSITVTHPWIINGKDTWNVEKECCADNKVSVDWSDTPAFLEVQLAPSPDNAITWQKVNWPDWTKVMRPVLNQTKIVDNNDKVAAAAWCTAWYLTDTLKTNDNTYFGWDTSWCKTRLLTKPRQLFRADMYNYIEHSYDLDPQEPGAFLWIDSIYMDYDITNPLYIWRQDLGTVVQEYLVITIPRTWWYQINMQWSYTCSWIHTVRNQICLINWNVLWAPLLDSREEWSWRVDQNANDVIDTQQELNKDLSLTIHASIAAANWEELSISTAMRWHWFWWSRTLLLNAWDKLAMVYKYNSIIKNNFTLVPTETSITFTSTNTDLSTNWRWAGTWRSIHELSKFSLTD